MMTGRTQCCSHERQEANDNFGIGDAEDIAETPQARERLKVADGTKFQISACRAMTSKGVMMARMGGIVSVDFAPFAHCPSQQQRTAKKGYELAGGTFEAPAGRTAHRPGQLFPVAHQCQLSKRRSSAGRRRRVSQLGQSLREVFLVNLGTIKGSSQACHRCTAFLHHFCPPTSTATIYDDTCECEQCCQTASIFHCTSGRPTQTFGFRVGQVSGEDRLGHYPEARREHMAKRPRIPLGQNPRSRRTRLADRREDSQCPSALLLQADRRQSQRAHN